MAGPITALVVDSDRSARQRLAEIWLLTAASAWRLPTLPPRSSRSNGMRSTYCSRNVTADGEGISLICATRRRRPTSQAVVVAAHASLEMSIEALRHRVADFVLKPISDLKIASALERARGDPKPPRRRRAADCRHRLGCLALRARLHSAHGERSEQGVLGGNLRDWKQRLVREAVTECQGNKAAAAHALGISRRTLYRILETLPPKTIRFPLPPLGYSAPPGRSRSPRRTCRPRRLLARRLLRAKEAH